MVTISFAINRIVFSFISLLAYCSYHKSECLCKLYWSISLIDTNYVFDWFKSIIDTIYVSRLSIYNKVFKYIFRYYFIFNLGGKFWSSFDKFSISFYLMSPLVIGFTTYSLQSSIYYSMESVFLLLIGDLVLSLFLSLIMASCLELPINYLQKYIFSRLF